MKEISNSAKKEIKDRLTAIFTGWKTEGFEEYIRRNCVKK